MTDTENDPRGRESSRDPIAGFLSGLLLMTPGVFPSLSPVHLIAFVPLLLVLRRATSWRQRLDIGLLMGLGFVAPQVLLLRLPAPMSVLLVAYFLALIIAFVCVSSFLVRDAGVWSSLAFGALLVVLDWVTITALPMWGTAQSFARPWSWYPKAVAFTSITGITGIVFVLGVIQSLAVTFALHGRHRAVSLATLIAGLAVVVGVDAAILTGSIRRSLSRAQRVCCRRILQWEDSRESGRLHWSRRHPGMVHEDPFDAIRRLLERHG